MCANPYPSGGEGMVYDENLDVIYLGDVNSGNILKYDMATQDIITTYTGYPCTYDVALSSDGTYLYGTSCTDVFRINTMTGALDGIRLSTDFTGTGELWGIAVHPTTGEVYVSKGFFKSFRQHHKYHIQTCPPI